DVRVAPPDERADVALGEPVRGHGVDARALDLLGRERQLHAVDLRRVREALDVLAEPEDRGPLLGVVAADAFEHAGSVVEDVRQHVYLGVVPGHELAVHPDLLALGQCHGASPPRMDRGFTTAGARGSPGARATRCAARAGAAAASTPHRPRTRPRTDRTPEARARPAPATRSTDAPAGAAHPSPPPPPGGPRSSRTPGPPTAPARP